MSGHNTGACAPISRGTSNSNSRGNTVARRQRREWLVEAYRADVDAIVATLHYSAPPYEQIVVLDPRDEEYVSAVLSGAHAPDPVRWGVPACRCYRCGRLLTADTVTVDRIFAGKLGGLYRTVRRDRREKVTNVRPACGGCNSTTGGALADRPKRGRS